MVPTPSPGETGDCWLGWFDGAALPNPGKLGLGVVLQSPDGSRVEFSERGEGTGCSNEAELQAVCAALSLAHAAGAQRLVLSGDSDFAVRHAAGSAHTAVPRLMALIARVQALAGLFEAIEWQWVPRYRNGDADRLSRGALGLVHKPAPHPGKALAAKRRRRKR